MLSIKATRPDNVASRLHSNLVGLLLKVGRERGTWDLGTWGRWDVGTRGRGDAGTWGRWDSGTRGRRDSGTWGRGDVGTQGRGNSGTWYARTSELGDARGFEDVINK